MHGTHKVIPIKRIESKYELRLSHITSPIFIQNYDIVFYIFQGITVQEILFEQIYRSFGLVYIVLIFTKLLFL